MTDKIVELIRRFAPMSSRAAEWDFLMAGTGKPQRWYEIEDAFRVLIIADPGAGKTFEAQTRARRIKERGRHAFFIRIEKIDGNFEQAFEVGTAAEFASWLASTEEAWFFLDSVDEAQLETPRALEDAVRVFGSRCHAALDRRESSSPAARTRGGRCPIRPSSNSICRTVSPARRKRATIPAAPAIPRSSFFVSPG